MLALNTNMVIYSYVGYQFNYDANGFSAGVGYQIPTRFAIINVDYAYTNMGDLAESFLKSAHRLSIKLRY